MACCGAIPTGPTNFKVFSRSRFPKMAKQIGALLELTSGQRGVGAGLNYEVAW